MPWDLTGQPVPGGGERGGGPRQGQSSHPLHMTPRTPGPLQHLLCWPSCAPPPSRLEIVVPGDSTARQGSSLRPAEAGAQPTPPAFLRLLLVRGLGAPGLGFSDEDMALLSP